MLQFFVEPGFTSVLHYLTVLIIEPFPNSLPLAARARKKEGSHKTLSEGASTLSSHWLKRFEHLQSKANCALFGREWSDACIYLAAISSHPYATVLLCIGFPASQEHENLPRYESSGLPAVRHQKVKNCY